MAVRDSRFYNVTNSFKRPKYDIRFHDKIPVCIIDLGGPMVCKVGALSGGSRSDSRWDQYCKRTLLNWFQSGYFDTVPRSEFRSFGTYKAGSALVRDQR